jgi:hypothetical protein
MSAGSSEPDGITEKLVARYAGKLVDHAAEPERQFQATNEASA